MRQFLIKFTTAFIVFLLVLYFCCFIGNKIVNKYDVNVFQSYGFEVKHSILKSKKQKKVKILLIGDSVADQLYSNFDYNSEIYSLASTQAISVAGQYFLLKNFFENNSNNLPDEVLFLYSPFSLAYNFDKFSYHYFLKPFLNKDYSDNFNFNLISRIEQVPYYYTAKLLIVSCSNYSPRYEIIKDSSILQSQVTKDYLKKIIEICDKNGVTLKLVSTPIRESRKIELNNLMAQQREEIKKDTLLSKYLSTVRYFKDDLFGDPMHFKKEYVPIDYLGLHNLKNNNF